MPRLKLHKTCQNLTFNYADLEDSPKLDPSFFIPSTDVKLSSLSFFIPSTYTNKY